MMNDTRKKTQEIWFALNYCRSHLGSKPRRVAHLLLHENQINGNETNIIDQRSFNFKYHFDTIIIQYDYR